ncbi:MAG: outer membrane protein [Rhodomicrobium sp.]
MQKTLVAATLAAVLGMGGAAYAADIYTGGGLKDVPVYAPGISWTGFYLGVGGGGGATSSDLKAAASTDLASGFAEANGIGGMGGFGTVQVGYDRQLDSRFVVGAFFDYDFASIDSKLSAGISVLGTPLIGVNAPFNLTDSWTVGGRVGYLIHPNTLFYGLAGYTEAHFDLPAGAQNSTFSGWTAGAGIETNLGGAWFLKGEYRYTSLDQQTLYAGSFGETGHYKVTDQPDIQTGRLVLTYKFNPFGYEPLK